jgi:hypothetical protein
MAFRPGALAALLVLTALAGCSQPDDQPPAPSSPGAAFEAVQDVPIADTMRFEQSIVTPAQGLANDLYEPTMEASGDGTLYVAAHVVGAATTGTPAYYSTDDGASWQQLPFVDALAAPPPLQGSSPPPGDEGFIVAGDEGQAWMADIYAAGFSVTGWCDDGARQCYDNRYAYDRTLTATAPCDAQSSLNDRPWIAYANGTLLLVNNPGGGPMQIGSMPVPTLPTGAFDPVTGPKWNLCASPGGYIPGVPAARRDGFFAVPQLAGDENDRLTVVTGNVADIMDVQVHDVFDVTSSYGGTTNGGRTAFDGDGVLYVGAYNNTDPRSSRSQTLDLGKVRGQFKLSTSSDDGQTYDTVTFRVARPMRSLYLDSNLDGPCALLTWSQLGDDDGRSDWFVAHACVGEHGEPVLRDVSLAVDEGPHSAAHVMGAAAGPDGRAYFVNFEDRETTSYLLSNPISVWKQVDGPRLDTSRAS